ncbi:MAG: GNAT family N-acetyltransferase [Actinomycetota bacterium]|nr:GNAT family N-acetyltransferase [Actinomycetota bacterium]
MTLPAPTRRLAFREFSPADTDLLVALDSDPQVTHFITGGMGTTREEVVEHVLPYWESFYRDHPGYGYWAAETRSGQEFIGWFHLRPGVDGPWSEPELGYRLKRSAWGHGYATEGSRGLMEHAFSVMGAERVLAECMRVHSASRRVMEKCGMTLVREFRADWPYRIPGDEHGDVEYAIDRAAWA